MSLNFYRTEKIIAMLSCCVWLMSSCTESEKVFVAEVKTINEPKQSTDIDLEKVETDEVYSFLFSVYDSLLISSLPNTKDYFFYVADVKNNKMLGRFMRRGEGPNEYLGLNPIFRIELRGEDLVALTYEPFRRELLEWNITQSLKLGRDSVTTLGFYQDPTGIDLTYGSIYQIDDSKFVGYTTGISTSSGIRLLPTYWIFDGSSGIPSDTITVVQKFISNDNSDIGEHRFFDAVRSISPDNTKIASAMIWLAQINIINLQNNEIQSYRLSDSPSEDIFYTTMTDAKPQYLDVVCNNDYIFALYNGLSRNEFKTSKGSYWLHEYDWEGNLKNKYKLSTPIFKLWLDPSSDTLYGYSEPEDAIYKINIPR